MTWIGAAGALLTASALPAAPRSMWNYTFQNGIGEYLTGEWDSPTGGALNLSCKGRSVTIMAQIKGQAPPPNSKLRLIASSRAGSRETSFMTDAQGSVEIADAARSPAFRQLWADLRARDIVTVRYADGRFEVQSLDGAKETLPPTPCAE
jgi:type IV secretory pathway protease TraF